MSERERRGVLERPVMREAFRSDLRSRLLTEAAVTLAPRARPSIFTWTLLRPALAVAALALILAWGTTSTAAASLPGDPLYAVKRAGEDVQLALTFDDVARMQLLSDLADRRLQELAQVTDQRPSSAPTATAEYADAVQKFSNAVDNLRGAGSDDQRTTAEAAAQAAGEKHLPVLDALKDKVPDNAKPEIDRLIQDEQQRQDAAPTHRPSDDGKGKQTTRPATPTPARATPRPTNRATPTARPSEHD